MSMVRQGSLPRLREVVVACALALIASTATAQQSSSSNAPVLVAAGGVDVAGRYMFRGVRQNATGMVVWPFTELTARVLSRDGTLRGVEGRVGFWNSLNTGDTGADGPAGRSWYESRLSGTLGVRFSRGVTAAATYTAYVSPNDMFSTVKEIGVKLAVDDRGAPGLAAVRPYALLAFEIDTAPGMGQLDGGLKAGRYLELGATPGHSVRYATIAFPIRLGLSLRDYYELGSEDNTFGFLGVGATVTVPLGRAGRIGRWHVHGGLELQSLGETTKVFNGGDRAAVVASFGFGLRP
jgi:hypothetical protein